MKRSQVLTLLHSSLETYFTDVPKEAADQILASLELIGMKPPSRNLSYSDYRKVKDLAENPYEVFHRWDKE